MSRKQLRSITPQSAFTEAQLWLFYQPNRQRCYMTASELINEKGKLCIDYTHRRHITKQMSIPAELSWPMDLFFNTNNKHFFLSDDAIDAFNFKYVSTSQFKHIIKDVQRDRMRKKENEILARYVSNENSNESESEDDDSIFQKNLTSERPRLKKTEEIDQELERLKEDALPERKQRTWKYDSVFERWQKNKARSTENIEAQATLKDCNGPATYERSPISRLECSARTRNSQSEHTLRPKSQTSSRYCRSTNNVEYNYSTDGSDVDDWDMRVHAAAARKIFSLQKRISTLLDEIAFRLGRIPLPDGDRDLRRRQQRLAEFSIRFSRNYLYDLGRQIDDIRRHVSAISSNARIKPTRRVVSLHVQAIEQKLTSAHQLLTNALDAYCKHIPSSLLKGQPGKLKEILQIVVDLNDICTEIHLTADYYECGDVETPPLGKNTRNRCSAMLAKLRGSSDNESQINSQTRQSTPIRGQRNKKRGCAIDNFKGLPSRLSMYSPHPRLSGTHKLKRGASMCTRYQRVFGGGRKIPTEQHSSILQQPNNSPATCKSSKFIVKREKPKIRLPQKEDEIRTMMSTLPTDSEAGSSVALSGYSEHSVLISKDETANKNSSLNSPINHSKIVNDSFNDRPLVNGNRPRGCQVTDEELSSLIPVIADLMTLVKNQQNGVAINTMPLESMDALMDLLKKYRSSTTPRIHSSKEPNVDAQRIAKKSNQTQKNRKNMQLITVTAEECSRETNNSVDVGTRICRARAEQIGDLSKMLDSEPRVLRVAEASVESLLKYRKEYQRSNQSNPMYTSNSHNKPWDVVAWIADKLVEELVVDVTKEFQMEVIIQNLFEQEFKEY